MQREGEPDEGGSSRADDDPAGVAESLPTPVEAVSEVVDGAVAVVDGGWSFAYVGADYADLHGTTPAELESAELWTCYPDEERERLESEALPALSGSGRWSGWTVGRRADGSTFDQELTLVATEAGTVVVCREEVDPTARHREFDLSEVFVESLMEAIPDPMYAFDVEGRILRWNDHFRAVSGYDDEEIVGMTALDFVSEDDRERVSATIERVLADGTPTTIEAELESKDGSTAVFELSASPIEDDSGQVVGFAGTGRDVTERKERERELERYETLVERISDVVYALNEDAELTFVNSAVEKLTGYDREELLGERVRNVVGEGDWERGNDAIARLLSAEDRTVESYEMEIVTADGERVPCENRITLLPREDGTFRGTVGVVRDISERKERERELERQRDELATLNRINELIQAVIHALVDAASREEVERRVCDRLAASDLYTVAGVCERDPGSEGTTLRTGSGDRAALSLFTGGEGADEWTDPAARAVHAGEVQVVRDLQDGEVVPEAVADAAADRDVGACIAVPLSVGDTVYSTLVVGAARRGAFSEREQAGFEVLGDLMGFAIHAAQNERLLHADAVLELEFRVGPEGSPVARLSQSLDEEVRQRRAVPRGDDRVLHYVELPVAPDTALEALREDADVGDARVVEETDDGCVVELVAGDSAAARLTAVGATVGTATADDGVARLLAEVPPDIDLRQVVAAFEGAVPDGELIAKREADSDGRSLQGVEERLDSLLTERQFTAARAAYAAGYFDWPRESTAEEVAESLGVASPTLHQHLRKAEQALFGALLDGSAEE